MGVLHVGDVVGVPVHEGDRFFLFCSHDFFHWIESWMRCGRYGVKVKICIDA